MKVKKPEAYGKEGLIDVVYVVGMIIIVGWQSTDHYCEV